MLEGKLVREKPKRTISASGGLELLQMVSKLNIERCASEEAEPRRRVDMRLSATLGSERGGLGWSHFEWRRERVSARTLDSEEGWIVRSHIGRRGERI